jgi:hypothetical protein
MKWMLFIFAANSEAEKNQDSDTTRHQDVSENEKECNGHERNKIYSKLPEITHKSTRAPEPSLLPEEDFESAEAYRDDETL